MQSGALHIVGCAVAPVPVREAKLRVANVDLRMVRWLILALVSALLSGAAPSLEWAVKAEYLFKLVPFVDWPQDAFGSPSDAFHLCVVGQNPFGDLLDQVGQGQSQDQRPVSVLRLNAIGTGDHCQLMYVDGDPQFVAQSLAAVAGSPVLTVTDDQTMAKGIVNFVLVQNRVRFEIDRAAALRNHLNVSSKLLDLAVAPKPAAP